MLKNADDPLKTTSAPPIIGIACLGNSRVIVLFVVGGFTHLYLICIVHRLSIAKNTSLDLIFKFPERLHFQREATYFPNTSTDFIFWDLNRELLK